MFESEIWFTVSMFDPREVSSILQGHEADLNGHADAHVAVRESGSSTSEYYLVLSDSTK